MKTSAQKNSNRLKYLALAYDLPLSLLKEYVQIFQTHGLPVSRQRRTKKAQRIVMVSTHGYWADPPPAGVPDTGGQTYYVLEVSKALAKQGRQVIILARWFEPYPRVETFAENLWLIRIRAGGDEFVRKEEIYHLVPEMAEASTAASLLFGAQLAMGHYADGMTGAVEVGERLKIPAVVVPHSLGINKVNNLGFDPHDPEVWHDPQYNFWIRESLELAALKGANFEIANTIQEPKALKTYYGFECPHLVMPAGAGKDFFAAFNQGIKPGFLARFGLHPREYLIYFGRLAEAKNIPAVVAVLGESRKLNPGIFKDVKLVIVGGDPVNSHQEERNVKENIDRMRTKYKLPRKDVILIPNQKWSILSLLAKHSLFYVGMQLMEPFGMSVAEAMAAGAPVMISQAAGITKWLTQDENAVIVDPHKPRQAARKLVDVFKDKGQVERLSLGGHRLAKEKFSWSGIAKRQAGVMDSLHRGEAPLGVESRREFADVYRKTQDRAYHRAVYVWRGDIPAVKPKHKKASRGLVPHIREGAIEQKRKSRRVIVALGGESGAGKSEVSEYLRFSLRREGIWAQIIPGDAFFKLPPSENHKARLKAYEDGRLDDYLGPNEVDLKGLDSVLLQAGHRKNKRVFVPSDCRSLYSRRYENVPIDLTDIDVIFVDLTYSLLLKRTDLKVFFESDFSKRRDEIKRRNISRDPDQDFNFILKVLEKEHKIIQNLKTRANLIITNSYDVNRPSKR